MEKDRTETCWQCGAQWVEKHPQLENSPCPNCGSTEGRTIGLTVESGMTFHDRVEGKVGPPRKIRPTSKKKRYPREFIAGDDFCIKTKEWMHKIRNVDNENDHYQETVTDPKTGEIIHHCDEPLSAHTGHGSDKAPPSISGDAKTEEPVPHGD